MKTTQILKENIILLTIGNNKFKPLSKYNYIGIYYEPQGIYLKTYDECRRTVQTEKLIKGVIIKYLDKSLKEKYITI